MTGDEQCVRGITAGVVLEDCLPLKVERLNGPPGPALLARFDRTNEETIRLLGVLEERSGEMTAEEHPDIARLEHKIDLILELLVQALAARDAAPRRVEVRLCTDAIEWRSDREWAIGDLVKLELCLQKRLPLAVILVARVRHARREESGDAYRVHAELLPSSVPVQDLLDKYIFRFHRRAVAHRRGRPSGTGPDSGNRCEGKPC